jgi:hypothetical protein
MLGAVLLAAPVAAEDVVWRPAAPLVLSRAADGQVIGASPQPTWASDRVPPTSNETRTAPPGAPRPRELPGTLTELRGPILPPPAGFASDQDVALPPGWAGFAGKPAAASPPPTFLPHRPKDVPAARLAPPRL